MTESTEHQTGRTRLSVEELSARTGSPVRTIREYQTWMVLHPPTRDGRRAYYDESHVQRLEGIDRLQVRGYSIAAIRDLFDAWEKGAGLRHILGVDDSLGAPGDEAPAVLTRAQVEEMLPAVARSPRLMARARVARLLVADGDRLVARSPSLLQLVAEAIDAGVTPRAALELAASVTSAADEAGRAAAQLVAKVSGGAEVAALARRGRVLLGRAVATHTIDRVGHHLMEEAVDRPELADLVADIRIGSTERTNVDGRHPRNGTA